MAQQDGNEARSGIDYKLDDSVMHLLHRAQQAADELFAAAFADSGLTPRQLAVLVVVDQNEGTNQVGLVDATGIDRSTTADLVRRLMKKGLIARRRARHDARSNVLRLTDEGRSLLAGLKSRALAVDRELLATFSDADRERFQRALRQVALQPKRGVNSTVGAMMAAE